MSGRAQLVALLATPRDAATLGSAVALTIASGSGSAIAIVALWGARDLPEPLGALPGALRAARRLQLCGLQVSASGRLVRVVLPQEPADACAMARIALAERDLPLVLVLAHARAHHHDALLGEADAVLLAVNAAMPPGLRELALGGARTVAPQATTLDSPIGQVAHLLLTLGLVVPARLRSSIRTALAR